MSEIEIIGDLEIRKPIDKAPPLSRAQLMGTLRPDDMQIFMPQRVLLEIVQYSKTRLDVEVGGMLAGHLCSYRGVPWLDIQGYVIARKAVQTPASLRWTHEACASTEKERDERFSDMIFVGWHHTHPGYGVFLSSTDTFTHRSFFNLPWMVALVVDPRSEEMGFFQYKNSRLESCGFYYTR